MATEVGMSKLVDGTNINMDKFGLLRDGIGNHPDFIEGNLVRNSINSSHSIIFRLTIPSGTKLLYTGVSEVLLERDQSMYN